MEEAWVSRSEFVEAEVSEEEETWTVEGGSSRERLRAAISSSRSEERLREAASECSTSRSLDLKASPRRLACWS